MSDALRFGRYPVSSLKTADRDTIPVTSTPSKERPLQTTLALGKLIPEIVDLARLRVRENLSGE